MTIFFSALKLTVQPTATATGTVEAHLIPTIDFGVSAFGGTTKAEIFVSIDGSTSVTLDGSAQKNIGRRSPSTGDIRGRGLIGEAFFGKRSPGIFGDIADDIKGAASGVANAVSSAAGAVKGAVTGTDGASDTGSAPAAAEDSAAPSSSTGSGSFGGCVDVSAGLEVDVGADAAFFSIFSPSTQFSLFSKSFSLFKVRRLL